MNDYSSQALIEMALGLTQSLTAADRYDRLLSTVRQLIPCDAVVLLQGHTASTNNADTSASLKPLAQQGLTPDVLGREFLIAEHPRFVRITQSTQAVRFESDCSLPDPYDGLLLAHEGKLAIHACMGIPLYAQQPSPRQTQQQLIGVLTVDSMTPNQFARIPERILAIVSAMAAATLNTALLIEKLEYRGQQSQQVVEALTQEALGRDGGELLGQSALMHTLVDEIRLVAQSDLTVLITGETGVGKELVARTVHRESSRASKPLVYVNCAALPETLVESELFGHVKGAFTGAITPRAGKFSVADGGSIFLDEIGELDLQVQSKLLRALQNQEIQPVGQDHVERVDVRIIAATNRDLQQCVQQGTFRADLYHRLSVYPLNVPALRERVGDVALLAGHFVEVNRRKLGIEQLVLSSDSLNKLTAYHWPGNVRELEHDIGRAALRALGAHTSSHMSIPGVSSSLPVLIQPAHFGDVLAVSVNAQEGMQGSAANDSQGEHQVEVVNINHDVSLGLRQATDAFQRQLIERALAKHQCNWAAAARELQIDRANLVRLAKRLGLHIQKQITTASMPSST